MYSIYQVMPGDTIDSIANLTGTSMDTLIKINGLTNMELNPGNYIVVPMNINLPFTTYKVEKNDNIYSIAKKYNIDYKTLLEINGIEEDDYIYPNQEILIPNKNFNLYVTKENDSLALVAQKLNARQEDLIRDNVTIFLKPDQLILYKKSS